MIYLPVLVPVLCTSQTAGFFLPGATCTQVSILVPVYSIYDLLTYISTRFTRSFEDFSTNL